MTLEELRRLDAEYQRLAGDAEAVRRQRNEAIRALLDSGMRVAEVARALGVTRARIDQIARAS
jgi:predicted XRE-type DNA-binding protein